ncbi:hypothetical protein HZC09_07015 [Candidatus Micrarchaeota archaeon]|nr:hypothetical protein [Candidatus Micrarchaeota archaeon]
MAPRRKAFISAPLIGTIIFVSAVLFTLNLNRVEAADTSRVVNDAYQNRMVSLVEIYRTDINSVFRETLRRNIEEFILRPGWETFKLKNYDGSKYLDYTKIRQERCEGIREVSRDIICSISVETKASAELKDSFGYGIPAWVDAVSQPFPFEGIQFKLANLEQTRLLNPDKTSSAAIQAYWEACRDLVQKNMFDCNTFAQKRGASYMRCVDEKGKPVPGCEQGTFFMRLEPASDAEVYAALPRIQGDDGFGNTIRSGAIAEETIYLPVNVRVFKYDDYALEFYKGLAYGNQEKTVEKNSLGFADGICITSANAPTGKDDPCVTEEGIIGRTRGTVSVNNANQELFKKSVAAKIIQGPIKSAQTNTMSQSAYLKDRNTLKFNLALTEMDSCTGNTCKDIFTVSQDDIVKTDELKPEIKGIYYIYYGEVAPKLFIKDSHPAYRVRGKDANEITYTMSISAQPDLKQRPAS